MNCELFNSFVVMKEHSGMRPHDIVVLLKILVSGNDWMNKDLAASLKISPAEISYSLQRSVYAGLLDNSKKKVMRNALLDFIKYGLPYAFPAVKGPIKRGMPTAYAAPVISDSLMTNEMIVWPDAQGTAKGESVAPLYANAVDAALADKELYNILALTDVMRLGKVREKEIAITMLKDLLNKAHA